MPEGQLLWTPSDPDASEMARLMRARGLSDYGELWRWSVEDLDGFWGALWEWFEIDSAYERVLGSRKMPGAEWFPGASLSYAEQLFRAARPGEVAILHASESQPLAELTWDELAGGAQAGDFTVLTMPARLASLRRDPWHGFLDTRQSITAAMRRRLAGRVSGR